MGYLHKLTNNPRVNTVSHADGAGVTCLQVILSFFFVMCLQAILLFDVRYEMFRQVIHGLSHIDFYLKRKPYYAFE